MGAFLLCRNNVNTQPAQEVFAKKGVHHPQLYHLNGWDLQIFAKASQDRPQIYEQGESLIAVVGTMMYRAQNAQDSAQSLLRDFIGGSVDRAELYGQYTVIFYHDGKLSLLCDPLFCKHVYFDESCNAFSSSLSALCRLFPEKVSADHDAFLEKLITGVIVAPDTAVKGVRQLCTSQVQRINQMDLNVSILPGHQREKEICFDRCGFEESVKRRNRKLCEYLEKWKPFFRDGKVDLGLSGGFDSTLLFCLLNRVFPGQVHIHSHSTGHVHDHEKACAVKMCNCENIDCNVVQTKELTALGEDLDALMQTNLYYFDGMTSFDIAGFSETYSSAYRLSATQNSRYTMTGVGGELYRNKFAYKRVIHSGVRFLEDRFFRLNADCFAKKEEYRRIVEKHIQKAEDILQCKLHGRISQLCARRYYSEILMSDGQGHVIDAFQTASFCVAPFLEKELIDDGYCGIVYHGTFGEYQSAMIRDLSAAVAACRSSYGFSFDYVPPKERIKIFLRSQVSTKVWNRIGSMGEKSKTALNYQTLYRQNAKLKQAVQAMQKQCENVDWQRAVEDRVVVSNLSYLSYFYQELGLSEQ